MTVMSADEMAQLYRSVMTVLLDKHCPVVTIRRKTKHTTPWFDSECRAQRRRVRAAERRFLRTCCEVDRQKWLAKLKLLHALYELKNSTYWWDEIAASKGDMRKLWLSLSGVLGETSNDVFDDHSAADFAAFFTDKIDAVRASTSTTPPYKVVHSATATSTMDTWPAVTTDEVKKLTDSALNKTCQLDPAQRGY